MNCLSCAITFERYKQYCNDCNGGKKIKGRPRMYVEGSSMARATSAEDFGYFLKKKSYYL